MAPPASTIQPASSVMPAAVTMRVASTSERTGLPRIAALDPISAGRPSTSTTMPRLPTGVSGAHHSPTTNPDDDELSATTSASANWKFSYRESMISAAGATAATASIAWAEVSGPSMSRPSRNAISGSTRGWT